MDKPKKVVITQNALHFLAGSEIVTLELAEYLKKNGIEVIVFTWYLADPMAEEFKRRKIKVTTDENAEILKSPDLVWVHHQVLPSAILESLKTAKSSPAFVFFHMSSHVDLYLEQPYVYNLEARLAAKSLFVSKEAYDFAKMTYLDFDKLKTGIFLNFIPEQFTKPATKKTALKKVLIVSNHSTPEFKKIIPLLANKNIEVDTIGQIAKPSLIDYTTLNRYDVVIAIGKTVQYCLGMGLPVYVYDKFGGPGYLNAKNFKTAENKNFSGRGFTLKTAPEIVKEIIDGYNETIIFQTENREKFCEQFSLNNQFNALLKELKPRKIEPFSKQYLSYVKSIETIAKDKVVAENGLVVTLKECNKFRAAYNDTVTKYNDLIKVADTYGRELEKSTHELAEIKNRKSYNVIRGIDRMHKIIKGSKGRK